MCRRGRRGTGSCHPRPLLALTGMLAFLVRSTVGEGPGIVMFSTSGKTKFHETVKHYDLYTHSLEEIENPITLRGCVYPCRCKPTLGAPWDKLTGKWYLVAENPKMTVAAQDTLCQGIIVNSTHTMTFLQTSEEEWWFPAEIRHLNNTIWQVVNHRYSMKERHSGLYQYVTLHDDETLIIYQCGPIVQKQLMEHMQIFSSQKTEFSVLKAILLSNKYSTNSVPYVRWYNNEKCKI